VDLCDHGFRNYIRILRWNLENKRVCLEGKMTLHTNLYGSIRTLIHATIVWESEPIYCHGQPSFSCIKINSRVCLGHAPISLHHFYVIYACKIARWIWGTKPFGHYVCKNKTLSTKQVFMATNREYTWRNTLCYYTLLIQ